MARKDHTLFFFNEEFDKALRECDEARAQKLQDDYEANPPVRAFNEGERVIAHGKRGVVRYCYTNGFTLIEFPGEVIAVRNKDITRV